MCPILCGFPKKRAIHFERRIKHDQNEKAVKVAENSIKLIPVSSDAWDTLYYVIKDSNRAIEADKIKAKADALFQKREEIKSNLINLSKIVK